MFLEGSGELAHLRLIKTWLGGICGNFSFLQIITEGAPAPEVLLAGFNQPSHTSAYRYHPAYIALYAFF